MSSFATTRDLPSPVLNPARAGSALLLINGIVLGATALVQAMFDLAGTFVNAGPLAGALSGNPSAIGFFEAHGLALIVAVLMIAGRNRPGAKWHWVAAATHLLLGGANLIFWSSFTTFGLVPMGVIATVMHGVFLAAELTAAFAKTPAILGGPGAIFRISGLITIATGIVLHVSSLPLGREAFVENLFTPLVDTLFAIPMTVAVVSAALLWRRAILPTLWQKLFYGFVVFFLGFSVLLHVRTLVVWDTSYVEAFPAWYPLPAMIYLSLIGLFIAAQRFTPAARIK